MSRLLIAGADASSRLSRPQALASAIALFAAVTLLDYEAGARLSVAFLYLIACAFAVWCLGDGLGIAVMLCGAVVGAIVRHAQMLELMPTISLAAESWNTIGRILSSVVVAVIVSGLRNVLALERWRGNHDELTGALNKAGFERAMEGSIARTRTRGGNLLLAYMDLDGFKGVNDRFGHSAGDHVLRAFANAAAVSIRPSDLFARIGGDEFVTLLAMPPQVDGHRVAELLHARLTTILGQTGFDVTCSMGAVFVAGEQVGMEGAILDQADALMYEVKRAGKNAFRVARGTTVGKALRSCFPPVEGDELDDLLKRIDLAERRQGWGATRAA